MPFGQQAGPPAPVRQVQELLALLQAAGHTDFRDARGPMGFTQRQAAGKFTRDEAGAFIERLRYEQEDADPPVARARPSERQPTASSTERQPTAPSAAPSPGPSPTERALRRLPADQLAAELRRRGWTVAEP